VIHVISRWTVYPHLISKRNTKIRLRNTIRDQRYLRKGSSQWNVCSFFFHKDIRSVEAYLFCRNRILISSCQLPCQRKLSTARKITIRHWVVFDTTAWRQTIQPAFLKKQHYTEAEKSGFLLFFNNKGMFQLRPYHLQFWRNCYITFHGIRFVRYFLFVLNPSKIRKLSAIVLQLIAEKRPPKYHLES